MGRSRLTAIIRRLYHAVTDLHWTVLAGGIVLHMAAVWLLMSWAGETGLTEPATFLYWYATTASTVGYGDVSPESDAGRLLTAFVVYPGAIAAFTAIIAKSLAGLSAQWRRRRVGLGDYRELTNAVVLVGYDAERTPRMIDELVADADPSQELVLLTKAELDNDDERVRYVRARSLTAAADLERAGITAAARVIVFASNDNETLAAALAITALNRSGHIVCFFEEEENARLLTAHCPSVEVVLAPTAELVVKAVKDPGSSRLLNLLASHTDSEATLFSLAWPGDAPTPFRAVADRLIERGAVLLAVRSDRDGSADFRFETDGIIGPNDRIFYVAAERLRTELFAG